MAQTILTSKKSPSTPKANRSLCLAPRKLKDFCKFMQKMGARSFTDDTNYCLFKMDLQRIEAELSG